MLQSGNSRYRRRCVFQNESQIFIHFYLFQMPSLPLISLETLDLSLNNISTIPFEFSHNLTNLRRLEMADNKILSIPLTVNAFTKLEYLGISGNPLESINIQQSFSVRELDLRNISLDVLEVCTSFLVLNFILAWANLKIPTIWRLKPVQMLYVAGMFYWAKLIVWNF